MAFRIYDITRILFLWWTMHFAGQRWRGGGWPTAQVHCESNICAPVITSEDDSMLSEALHFWPFNSLWPEYLLRQSVSQSVRQSLTSWHVVYCGWIRRYVFYYYWNIMFLWFPNAKVNCVLYSEFQEGRDADETRLWDGWLDGRLFSYLRMQRPFCCVNIVIRRVLILRI